MLSHGKATIIMMMAKYYEGWKLLESVYRCSVHVSCSTSRGSSSTALQRANP